MTMMYTHNENINEIINVFMNIFIKTREKISKYEHYDEKKKKITIKREISEYIRINTNNKKLENKINNLKKKTNDFYVYYNINMLNDSGKADFIYRMLHNNDFTTIYDIKYNDILLNNIISNNNSNDNIANNNIINNNNSNNNDNIAINNNVVNYDNSKLYFMNGMYYNNVVNYDNSELYFINGMYYKNYNNQLLYDPINGLYYKLLIPEVKVDIYSIVEY